MSRLPNVGSDDGTWGGVLNDFLQQSHNADGSLKTTAVSTAGAEMTTNKDTDGTLAANSDTKYPSQKAVKTYVGSQISAIDTDDVAEGSTNLYSQWKHSTYSSNDFLQPKASDHGLVIGANLDSTAETAFSGASVVLNDSTGTSGVGANLIANLSYGTSYAPLGALYISGHARGTASSPSQTLNNDMLGGFTFSGFGTTEWVSSAASHDLPGIYSKAVSNVTDSALEAKIFIGGRDSPMISFRTDNNDIKFNESQLDSDIKFYSDTGTTLAMDGGTGASVLNNTNASAVTLTVKGAASQTANLQEWHDSSGTPKMAVDKDGRLILNSTAYLDGSVAGQVKVSGDIDSTGDINIATGKKYKINGTALAAGDVGLGNVDNTSDASKNSATVTLTNKTLTSPVIDTGVSGTAIDTDGTLAANSDTKLASQKAVKTYVGSQISAIDTDDIAQGTTNLYSQWKEQTFYSADYLRPISSSKGTVIGADVHDSVIGAFNDPSLILNDNSKTKSGGFNTVANLTYGTGFGGTGASYIAGRALGTASSPTQVMDGTLIGGFSFRAFGTTDWATSTTAQLHPGLYAYTTADTTDDDMPVNLYLGGITMPMVSIDTGTNVITLNEASLDADIVMNYETGVALSIDGATGDAVFGSDISASNLSGTNTGDQDLSSYQTTANLDTTTTLGTSDTKYPSQKAVKTYVDDSIIKGGVRISLANTDSTTIDLDPYPGAVVSIILTDDATTYGTINLTLPDPETYAQAGWRLQIYTADGDLSDITMKVGSTPINMPLGEYIGFWNIIPYDYGGIAWVWGTTWMGQAISNIAGSMQQGAAGSVASGDDGTGEIAAAPSDVKTYVDTKVSDSIIKGGVRINLANTDSTTIDLDPYPGATVSIIFTDDATTYGTINVTLPDPETYSQAGWRLQVYTADGYLSDISIDVGYGVIDMPLGQAIGGWNIIPFDYGGSVWIWTTLWIGLAASNLAGMMQQGAAGSVASGDDGTGYIAAAPSDVKTYVDSSVVRTVNAQTGISYTFALSDKNTIVTASNSSAQTYTIPTNASVSYSVGTQLILSQIGTGAVTAIGDTGVTVNGISGGYVTSAQYQTIVLYKIATNTWQAEIQTPANNGVAGAASSTDNGVARFDGTTGKIIQNSSQVTIGDNGYIVQDLGSDGKIGLLSLFGAPLMIMYNDSADSQFAFALGGNGVQFGAGGSTATDTSLTRASAGVFQMNGNLILDAAGTAANSAASIDATQTLTNKRFTPRVGTAASSATPTINTDSYDAYSITALAVGITSFTTNLSGTPTDFQELIIRIKDNGTPRTITWGASFAAKGVALPTTTVASKELTVAFIFNGSVWGCVGKAQE